MNPLALLAVVGVALALLFKKTVADAAQAQAQEHANQDAADPSTPTGSFAETQDAVSHGKDRGMQGTLAGVSIGMQVAGPFGALVGALVGSIVGLYFTDNPDPQDWHWWLWAMPNCTSSGWWDEDGSNYNLPLPTADSGAITVLTVPRKWFVENYPDTDGDWASPQMNELARSGMFSWRPREQQTPFSQLLYSMAPWLLAYEDTYLTNLTQLVAWKDADGTQQMPVYGSFGNDAAFRTQVIGMRRVFASVAVYGADAVKRQFLQPFITDAPLGFNRANDAARTLHRLVDWMSSGKGGGALGPGVVVFQEQSAGTGYPNSYRITTKPATVAKPSLSPLQLAGGVRRDDMRSVYAAQSMPQTQAAAMLGVAHSIGAGGGADVLSGYVSHQTTETDRAIEVWLPGPTIPTDRATYENRTATDTWGTSQVVRLSHFVGPGAYASLHDVVEELDGRKLVYSPYTAPKALRVWQAMFPALAKPDIDARRVRAWGAV